MRRHNVFLVEDHTIFAESLKLLLEARPEFCVIGSTDSCYSAVDMAKKCRPDLILMDLSLPVKDGWEATQELKSTPQTQAIPVIALSAHAMSGDRDKALDAGRDAYETKPVELPKLMATIEPLLP